MTEPLPVQPSSTDAKDFLEYAFKDVCEAEGRRARIGAFVVAYTVIDTTPDGGTFNDQVCFGFGDHEPLSVFLLDAARAIVLCDDAIAEEEGVADDE